MLNAGEAVTFPFPFRRAKVEFLPKFTDKVFPLAIVNVLSKLAGFEEYSPTAPSPIVNVVLSVKFTLASPSE